MPIIRWAAAAFRESMWALAPTALLTRSVKEQRRPTAQGLVPPAVLRSSVTHRSAATIPRANVVPKASVWPALAAAQSAALFAAGKQERKGCRFSASLFILETICPIIAYFFRPVSVFFEFIPIGQNLSKFYLLFPPRWKQRGNVV